MKFRCMIDTFIDVDAENDDEAQRKAAEKLCAALQEDARQIIVWPKEELK